MIPAARPPRSGRVDREVTGGVLHIVTRYALEDRVAELPSALAELTHLALGPYLPADEILKTLQGC